MIHTLGRSGGRGRRRRAARRSRIAAHARNGLARVAQNGTPAEQKKVKAAVRKRFPGIRKKTAKAS